MSNPSSSSASSPPARSSGLWANDRESFSDRRRQGEELDVLRLHLVQHGQVVVVSGELRPNEGPKRRIFDLMVVAELLIDVLPGPREPLRPLSTYRRRARTATLSRFRSRRNASWIG